MLTPELRELANVEDQALIAEMSADVEELRYGNEPAYRADLPGHNYDHIYQEVLPESLRLLKRDKVHDTPNERQSVIGASILHDIFCTVPLDPAEGFRNAEERAAVLGRPILLDYLGEEGTALSQQLIGTTAPGAPCDTPLEVIVRRADISNVGSKNTPPFLAKTLNFFHEDIILWRRAVKEKRPAQKPVWLPFLAGKVIVLSSLGEPDLAVGSEPHILQPDGRRLGQFNVNLERNIKLLETKRAVHDPAKLHSTYGQYLRPLVADYDKVLGYIKGEVAA